MWNLIKKKRERRRPTWKRKEMSGKTEKSEEGNGVGVSTVPCACEDAVMKHGFCTIASY